MSALATLALLMQATPEAAALDVWGRWQVEGGRGVVTIEDCGDGTPCGTLTSVPEGSGEAGQEVLGTRLLWDFERDEDAWEDGKILDPEADRTYGAEIRREGDALEVEGCWTFICKTQVWQRAE
ncbi:DUF2147 domain-containing protein [Parvularcula oceani]|uniref:DUF2147 domain-containing protein n=1 Tax=Parvularcula oceani TaxID=1247963 RepID=UPI000691E55F|nr:DUF2147 domain-containing protein [Parvularcula oceani]